MKQLFFFLLLLPTTAVSAQTQNWSACDSFFAAFHTLQSPDSAFHLRCQWRQLAEPISYRLTLESRLHKKILLVSETSVYDDGGAVLFWSADSRLLVIDSDDSTGRQTRVIDLRAFRQIQSVAGYLRAFDAQRKIAFVSQYHDATSANPKYALYAHDIGANRTALVIQMPWVWDWMENPQIQADPERHVVVLRCAVDCTNSWGSRVGEGLWTYEIGY
ncbi:MAG: hypothetical protein IPM81_03735 [Saprospirales bacterium]|nr:hypothetical protein [Saprospirales bacterium]